MSKITPKKLLRAYWLSEHEVEVLFARDWGVSTKAPPLFWGDDTRCIENLIRGKPKDFGKRSGYFKRGKEIVFVISKEHWHAWGLEDERVYVGGDFNGWKDAIGKELWRFREKVIDGEALMVVEVDWSHCFDSKRRNEFKFLNEDGHWLDVFSGAPNVVEDKEGNKNYEIRGLRTGHHIFQFKVNKAYDPRREDRVVWKDDDFREECWVEDGKVFEQIGSDLPMGAIVEGERTTFRLFSPRASKVELVYFDELKAPHLHVVEMGDIANGVWEYVVHNGLHGWYYYYRVSGGDYGGRSHFDETFEVLDPYALAAVGGAGPGIVIDLARVGEDLESFITPEIKNVVVLEAHVRDLVAKAPIAMKDDERLGFVGLRKWVETQGNYLRELGVNVIELQPVQENDAGSIDEYHWGYMPNNYFAPASQYGLSPEKASQMAEFRGLVNSMHKAGLAVILDVVYNHVGEPNHLLFVAKEYYFELSEGTHLMNFSGCGNDFKANTRMGRRLIIDSLKHWVQFYGVDGFRFDLAELLGYEVLEEIEHELRRVKEDVILIAEPWSFRGHIGYAMKNTNFSSWNDGYREFMTEYLLGKGNREGFEYYIKGSIDFLSHHPWQSVNYLESHDDYCWLDRITENADSNGSEPTLKDRRRMHLMVAVLMSSLGIPMLAQGQDILRSKQGVHNTYQRGDLNAVEYGDLANYAGTHEYFKRWIEFRLSEWGELIRLKDKPSDDYFQFYHAEGASAMGVHYNADSSRGGRQLLFAVNPHDWPLSLDVEGVDKARFKQIADHERLQIEGLSGAELKWEKDLIALPPLSCGLWVAQ